MQVRKAQQLNMRICDRVTHNGKLSNYLFITLYVNLN